MHKRLYIKKIFFFFVLFLTNTINAKEIRKKIIGILVRNTSIMIDDIFLKHHISPGHPESPDRIRAIQKALKENKLDGINIKIDHKRNVKKWIRTVHTEGHFQSIKKNSPLAFKVSTTAVNACLTATDEIMKGNSSNVFCATRPPGHHALNTGKEEGFCYFNNIAITAKYIQQYYKLERILIVDWDYHHGNATQDMFYNDNTVLFFSTHDQYAYPGTGAPEKKGISKGKGYNINIHLPCGTNDRKIVNVFKNILIPISDQFKPDMILISAGFDSKKDDPLGCFEISDNGFIELTKIVMSISKKYSNDRLISILEGGYNFKENANAAIAHIKALNNLV